jgi:hypothetical protein
MTAAATAATFVWLGMVLGVQSGDHQYLERGF